MREKPFVKQVIEHILEAHRSKRALKTISEHERKFLEAIRAAWSKPATVEEFIDAIEAPSHHLYKDTYTFDCATIAVTLEQKNPREFYMPIRGGRAFLEHILCCKVCQLITPAAETLEAKVVAAQAFGEFLEKVSYMAILELQKYGFRPTGRVGGATLRDELEPPEDDWLAALWQKSIER